MATPRKRARDELWKQRERDFERFAPPDEMEPDPLGNRRQRRAARKE